MNAKSPQHSTDRPDEGHYLAYLLRIWRASPRPEQARAGDTMWRASLEVPRSGRRLGFASLEDLFQFLRKEVASHEAESTTGDGECDR